MIFLILLFSDILIFIKKIRFGSQNYDIFLYSDINRKINNKYIPVIIFSEQGLENSKIITDVPDDILIDIEKRIYLNNKMHVRYLQGIYLFDSNFNLKTEFHHIYKYQELKIFIDNH